MKLISSYREVIIRRLKFIFGILYSKGRNWFQLKKWMNSSVIKIFRNSTRSW